MNSEERKIKIKEIEKGTAVATGTLLKYQGKTREFSVYKIPLEFLVYNVDNGHISSVVKSYNREHGTLDSSKETDSNLIAKFLFDSNEDRNKKTMRDLAENGQMEPGIITIDGTIVDGNRRASLLRRIVTSSDYNQKTKDACSYFLARILPEEADEKEILRLETSFQMGADSKVDYNAIEKYLHTRDLHTKKFTLEQIADYMGFESPNVVSLNLDIMALIDSYLDTYEYRGIYTRLPRGCEDDFLKLNTAIKKIQSGRIQWIPTDQLDEVETDLRNISFDFIRLEEKGDFDFRALASTSNNNFLNDETTWRKFAKCYNEVINENGGEEDLETILSKAKNDEDANRLLNQRDKKWKESLHDKLMDIFNDCKNIIENKKEKGKPESLLKKAINALSEIDLMSVSKVPNKLVLTSKINELIMLANNINNELTK